MFNPQHCGLIFTEQHIQEVRRDRKRPPLNAAWDYMLMASPALPLARAQLDGLSYRFNADTSAGAKGVDALVKLLNAPQLPEKPYLQQVVELLAMAQCIEMLREHPAFEEGEAHLKTFFERVNLLNNLPENASFPEQVWLAALNIAAGIVLEREDIFQAGTQVFTNAIDSDVHPEGYISAAVNISPEAVSLQAQMMTAQALVLIAEMASHAGIDLWHYEKRGVSVITAAVYPLYYYFYPEKWKWNGEQWKPSEGVTEEDAKRIFKENCGFLEILNRRYERPLKAVKMILDEIRPVFDVYGGGLTTLTHAKPESRGILGIL